MAFKWQNYALVITDDDEDNEERDLSLFDDNDDELDLNFLNLFSLLKGEHQGSLSIWKQIKAIFTPGNSLFDRIAEKLDKYDRNGDGKTTIIEFFEAIIEGSLTGSLWSKIKAIFGAGNSLFDIIAEKLDKYDRNGDGKTTLIEFFEAIILTNDTTFLGRFLNQLKNADTNGDGNVSFAEFFKLLTGQELKLDISKSFSDLQGALNKATEEVINDFDKFRVAINHGWLGIKYYIEDVGFINNEGDYSTFNSHIASIEAGADKTLIGIIKNALNTGWSGFAQLFNININQNWQNFLTATSGVNAKIGEKLADLYRTLFKDDGERRDLFGSLSIMWQKTFVDGTPAVVKLVEFFKEIGRPNGTNQDKKWHFSYLRALFAAFDGNNYRLETDDSIDTLGRKTYSYTNINSLDFGLKEFLHEIFSIGSKAANGTINISFDNFFTKIGGSTLLQYLQLESIKSVILTGVSSKIATPLKNWNTSALTDIGRGASKGIAEAFGIKTTGWKG